MNRLVLGVIGLSLLVASCTKLPETAAFEVAPRSSPFFRVVVFERLKFPGDGTLGVNIILVEDEAGTCYVTSGEDGGVQIAPQASCARAKGAPVERPASYVMPAFRVP